MSSGDMYWVGGWLKLMPRDVVMSLRVGGRYVPES